MMVASSALAAGAIESKPVRFAKGASSAATRDSIKGDQTIDYRLRGKPGKAGGIWSIEVNDVEHDRIPESFVSNA
jgi:hypothetical protein